MLRVIVERSVVVGLRGVTERRVESGIGHGGLILVIRQDLELLAGRCAEHAKAELPDGLVRAVRELVNVRGLGESYKRRSTEGILL